MSAAREVIKGTVQRTKQIALAPDC